MAIRIGVVMKVVTSAMRTIMVNRAGDRTPRSSPAFRITSSTNPRVFIRTPRASESLHVIPVVFGGESRARKFAEDRNYDNRRAMPHKDLPVSEINAGPQAGEREE